MISFESDWLAFAWLIEMKRIDIKIALVEDDSGIGIYHEKIGVFFDAAGEIVAFTGSANESSSGLVSNFESIHVFRSWLPADEERAHLIQDDFENLWQDLTPGLRLYPFPEAARRELLRFRTSTPPKLEPEELAVPELLSTIPSKSNALGIPNIPHSLQIRDYQRSAVQKWFENQGRGIFQMATGTGKTITALALIHQLFRGFSKDKRPLTVFVLCPYKHLVSQWAEEAIKFGVYALQCMDARSIGINLCWSCWLRKKLVVFHSFLFW